MEQHNLSSIDESTEFEVVGTMYTHNYKVMCAFSL